MRLQRIKMMVFAGWVLAALVIGLVIQVTSALGLFGLAVFGLLPPLVMLLLWNDPQQTMSESINQGRR